MSRATMTGMSVWVGLAALALVGCAPEPPLPEESEIDLASEELAVRAINTQWLELAKARDAEAIGELFAEDAWTLSGSDGVTEGRAAIVEQMKAEFEENPDAVVSWGAKDVWIAESGDLAVERGWWKGDDDGEGEAEVEVEGEYLTVFVKVGDEWKVLADAAATLEGTEEES